MKIPLIFSFWSVWTPTLSSATDQLGKSSRHRLCGAQRWGCSVPLFQPSTFPW
jgi:hypothetical protein